MTDKECPYCGKEFEYYSDEDRPFTYYEVGCEHCEKDFEVETWDETTRYFESRKLEGSGDE